MTNFEVGGDGQGNDMANGVVKYVSGLSVVQYIPVFIVFLLTNARRQAGLLRAWVPVPVRIVTEGAIGELSMIHDHVKRRFLFTVHPSEYLTESFCLNGDLQGCWVGEWCGSISMIPSALIDFNLRLID